MNNNTPKPPIITPPHYVAGEGHPFIFFFTFLRAAAQGGAEAFIVSRHDSKKPNQNVNFQNYTINYQHKNITIMRSKTVFLLAILAMATTGIWAQNEVAVNAVAGQTNQWQLTMPAGNVRLNVEYKTQTSVTMQYAGAEVAAAGVSTCLGDEPLFLDSLALAVVEAETPTQAVEGVTLSVTSSDATVVAFGTNNEASGALADIHFLATGTATLTILYAGSDNYGSSSATLALTVAEHTYTVTIDDGEVDPDRWTVAPAAAVTPGVTAGTAITATYSGTRKVKSVRAMVKQVAPTYTLLSAATAEDIGKVVCAAGHLHDEKTAVPDGCTAVGILGKVTETGHGLILALQNATAQTWNTINGWESVSTYASATLKVLPDEAAQASNLTSYTTLGETAVSDWAVAQKSDYDAIFTNLGSTTGDNDGKTYDGNVNAYITTGVGGTAISGYYWSATATEGSANAACIFGSNYWDVNNKSNRYSVRPVLAF